MKFLVVLLFTITSIIRHEVAQAAFVNKEHIKEELGQLKFAHAKELEAKFSFDKKISRDEERSAEEEYVRVDSSYEPKLEDTDFDLNEDSLGTVGFPDDVADLAVSNTEFGQRCDFVLNKNIKQFNTTGLTNVSDPAEFFLAMGFSSQTEFVDKCEASGQACACDAGLECQETDYLNSVIGNVEFQDRAGKTCLFRRTCVGGDKSPFETCVNVEFQSCMTANGNDSEKEPECQQTANLNCSFEEKKCFYTDKCLGIIASKSDVQNEVQSEGVMVCEDNYNCSSGYCKEFIGEAARAITGEDVGAIKLCAKPAECRPACTPVGEDLNDSSVDFCCSGSMAYDDGAKVSCIDPSEIISVGPPMFNVEINPVNCTGGIYEDSYVNEDGEVTSASDDLGLDNSMSDEISVDDYSSWSKENKKAYTDAKARRISRILRSFEYLWSNANSKGLDDTFQINKYVTDIGEKMKKVNESIEKDTALIHYRMEQAQKDLEKSMVGGNEVSSSERAAGVSTLKMLAGYNYDLGNMFSLQSEKWYDILGMRYDPLTYEEGEGDSIYTKSFESSYQAAFGGNSNSTMPEYFSKDSVTGLLYMTRHPSQAGKTGRYTQYHKNTDIGLFEGVELPCKNMEGDAIMGKVSDWFGDKKDNSVCIKEMARIKSVKNGDWIELVNPIYPEGLLGSVTDNSLYMAHMKDFPNVHRPLIENEKLISNISSGIEQYASEQLDITSCHAIDRFKDEMSDSEFKMLVKLEVDPGITSEDLEVAKTQARELYGDQWRTVLASKMTKDFIYNTLVGTHQNNYARDGFDFGGGFFGFIAGIVITVSTLGMVCPLCVDGDNKYYANEQNLTQLLYKFVPFLISKEDEEFGVWSGGCFTDNCEDKKYLNSVSFDTENEIISYAQLLDNVFYLESFSKAKELYHKEVAVCLNNLAKNYSEAFGAEDFDSSIVVGDQDAQDFNSTCSSGEGSSSGAGFDIESQDVSLSPQDIQLSDSPELGIGMKADSVTVANGSIEENKSGISSFNPRVSDEDPGKLKGEISKLREGLDKRNQTANGIQRKKSVMLDRLSGGRLSGSVKKAKEIASMFKTKSLNPLVSKLKKGLKQRGVASAVSTRVQQIQKPVDKKDLLKKANRALVKKNSKQEDFKVAAYQPRGGSYKSYGNNRVSDEQLGLARDVKNLRNRIKHKDAEEIWDIISKTYLLHGVPRLFDLNAK